MIQATKRAEKWLLNTLCFHALLLLVLTNIAAAGTTVSYLPGFDGELPFKLQSGYIGVGKWNESQMFNHFVESQRNPEMDPLVLWLSEGPGCSSMFAFFYEPGKHNNQLALDSLTLQHKKITMLMTLKSAAQTYNFLRKWLLEHPQYLTNKLFIGGDSYSGISFPIVVQHIVNGNEAGLELLMNLKGYTLGTPFNDHFIDFNSSLPAAYRLSLILEELHESAKLHCSGDYVNINSSNEECASAINQYKYGLMTDVFEKHFMFENLAYTMTVRSSVEFNRNLSEKTLQVLIYSGDHELTFTHIDTHNWIRTLNLTKDENWRAWFVDGQVAGYTEEYINGDYTLIFITTVKVAGHVPIEYKPKELSCHDGPFFAYLCTF